MMGQVQVGTVTMTLLDAGELEARLEQWFTDLGRPADREPFAQSIRIPIQCVHLALPGMSVLVDAPAYDFPPEYPYRPPGYHPPPGIVPQLAARGIAPEAITHVIITHAHGDHFNGTTQAQHGHWRPTFPGAHYYLGRPDWHAPEFQTALGTPASLEARTLGVLQAAGLLELVDDARDLGGGVQVIPAPGESPGHQIVRVVSGNDHLYCVGDLYHHPIEVVQPAYLPWWADATRLQQSRQRLLAAALQEQARIVATHIPGIGRIEPTGEGVRWAST